MLEEPANDIFISYSSGDAVRVQILVAALEAEGWKVFWDREIEPGETWESYIGVQLDAAPVVIAVWSKGSVKSSFVRDETNRANKRGVLVPVLIDDVEPMFGFGQIHSANLVEWLAHGGGTLPNRLKLSILKRIPVKTSKSLPPNSLASRSPLPNGEASSYHVTNSQRMAAETTNSAETNRHSEEPRSTTPPSTQGKMGFVQYFLIALVVLILVVAVANGKP